MENQNPEAQEAKNSSNTSKKKDYIRYILAVIFFALAITLYIHDINKKKAIAAVQADINFIHDLVEKNIVNSIDMIIDIENDSKVNIMIPCSEEETKAITEALALAEPTDFLGEQREGKLFTIFLNYNNNARSCIEAAVVDDDPSNAYVRTKKPVQISNKEEKQEITWAYTAPAIMKGFGDFLNKLYAEKLPEIKRQSEFFQNALEKDENTKKLLQNGNSAPIILSPATKEQAEAIVKQVEAIKEKQDAATTPADEEQTETKVEQEAPKAEPTSEETIDEATPAAVSTQEQSAKELESKDLLSTSVDTAINIATTAGETIATTTAAVADVGVAVIEGAADIGVAAVKSISDVTTNIIDSVIPSKEETKVEE